MTTRPFALDPDDMDGGVTAAAIEAEVVSPERARSLVQERDEAKAWATRWQEAAEENEAEIDRLRAALAGALATVQTARSDLTTALAGYARSLTANDITDEMVIRGARAICEADGNSFDHTHDHARGTAIDHSRVALLAALTPPPSRPEGAEDIEALVDEWKLLPESPDCPLPTLPDFLAERGVRVTGAES